MPEPLTPILNRLSLVGGAEEVTIGTVPTITAPMSATQVYNAVYEEEDIFTQGERTPDGHYEGTVASVPGLRAARLRFTLYRRFGDTFLSMLTGCGMALNTTYKPVTSMASRKTWAFKVWQGGKVKTIAGAMGNVVLRFVNGAPLQADFEWRGIYVAEADASMPAFAPIATQPFVCINATTLLNSVTPPHYREITFDLGNQLELRENMEDTFGIAHGHIARRRPRMTIVGEDRLVAQLDNMGLMNAATEHAVSVALSDGTNSITVTAPKAQRIMVGQAEQNGIRMAPLTLQLNASSGDDEITITESTP